jgi:hypothetical protein
MMKNILNILIILSVSFLLSTCAKDSKTTNNYSKSGSLARFAIVDNVLYTIDNNLLKVIDISNPSSPQLVTTVNTTAPVLETIFQYEHYLLFGTPNGMLVYDINTRTNPVYVTEVVHIVGCDPVVAQNGYAYVTIRSGSVCRQNIVNNTMEVINIQDMNNAYILNELSMSNPKGLGIDDKLLFVTDGVNGIRVFNLDSPNEPREMNNISGADFIDVIADNKTLYALKTNGITQYDYTDTSHIVQLSTLNY